MEFDSEFEKLMEKYSINEGIFSSIGNAIKGTMKDVFVKPWQDPNLNPWAGHGDKGSPSKTDFGGEMNSSPNSPQAQQNDKINKNITQSYIKAKLADPVLVSKEINFIQGGKSLGKFALNSIDAKNKKVNMNNILIPSTSLTPVQLETAAKFLAQYDLRPLKLNSGNFDQEMKKYIDVELKKAKIEPSLFGGKERELLNAIKKDIEQYLIPMSLPAQRAAYIQKVIYFFILTKADELKK